MPESAAVQDKRVSQAGLCGIEISFFSGGGVLRMTGCADRIGAR